MLHNRLEQLLLSSSNNPHVKQAGSVLQAMQLLMLHWPLSGNNKWLVRQRSSDSD